MATQTTAHLPSRRRRSLRRWLREQDPWLLVAVVAIILLLGGIAIHSALRDRARARTEPIIIMATPALPTTAPPAPTEAPLVVASAPALRLPRAVVVYSQPASEAVIGAVDSGRAYTPTVRLDEWVQVDVAGSGLVWLRIADLAGLAGVPDLAPSPPIQQEPQQPAVLVVAPVAAEPAAQPTVAPPPTAVPPATPSWMVLNLKSTPADPAEFVASFEAPSGPNPFVGCITTECRQQFGQEVIGTP